MEIRDKIVIKEKESAACPMTDLVGTLRWKKPVDLDLWCFFKTKDGNTGRVGFNCRGGLRSFPFIQLDQDAGVGDTGGDNEENIRIKTLEHIEHAFICANIFNKSNARFSTYDGVVSVKSGNQEFEVPLTSKTPGSWCVIAHFDNTSPVSPKLENVNVTVQSEPHADQLIQGNFEQTPVSRRGGGLLSRLFGG